MAPLRGSTGRRSWHKAAAVLAMVGFSASVFVASSAGAESGHKAKTTVVSTRNSELGTILVSGKTLYTLKASKTRCTARCRRIWPELLLPKGVDKATAGKGVTAAKLGTVKRGGGHLQVTYAGKALYRFSGDKTARQVHGHVSDGWGTWSAVVTATPPTAPSPSTPAPTATTTPSTSPAPAVAPTPATAPTPTTVPPMMVPTTSPSPPVPPPPPPTTTPTTVPSTGGVSF